jgi:hypothetical protein
MFPQQILAPVGDHAVKKRAGVANTLVLLPVAVRLHENVLDDVLGVCQIMKAAEGELHKPVLEYVNEALEVLDRLRPQQASMRRTAWLRLTHGRRKALRSYRFGSIHLTRLLL